MNESTRTLFNIGITGALLVQWLTFAAISFFSRNPLPKKGMRPEEDRLAWSTAVTLVAWTALLVVTSRTPGSTNAPVRQAAAFTAGQGTCASIKEGMTSDEVRQRLGTPDREYEEDETRGPGARAWSYDSRCTIHIFDGNVDSLE